MLDGIICGLNVTDPASIFMVRLIARGVLAAHEWNVAEDSVRQMVSNKALPLPAMDLIWKTGLTSSVIPSTSSLESHVVHLRLSLLQARDQPASSPAVVSAPPPSSESTAAPPQSSPASSVHCGLHDPMMTEAAVGMKVGTGTAGGMEVEDVLVGQGWAAGSCGQWWIGGGGEDRPL